MTFSSWSQLRNPLADGLCAKTLVSTSPLQQPNA
jgi:hypothetical protein